MWVGGRSRGQTLGPPFGAFVTTVANVGGRPSKFGGYARCGWTSARFGRVLSFIFFIFFWSRALLRNFRGTTWHLDISPFCPVTCHMGMMSLPCRPSRTLPRGTSRGSHMFVRTAQSHATCLYGYHVIMPHHCTDCHISLPRHYINCHIIVWTATWHDPIGPWIGPKMPKLGDMW
jgi:hypothetical protein